MAGRNLHGGGTDHLHEVVDDDIAQRADGVVEVPAILDAEALGHGDLHRGEVVATPDRLERRVGEPQVEDLRDAHLPEEVVDPVQLRLVDVLVHLLGERASRLEVMAERLLHDDPRPTGEAGVGQPLDDVAEEERQRSKSSPSTVSPVSSIAVRARSRRSPTVQSSTATPTIGQFSRPRHSSR